MFSIVKGLVSFVQSTHQSIVCPDDHENAEDLCHNVENIATSDAGEIEDVQGIELSQSNKRDRKTRTHRKKSKVRYEAIDSDGNELSDEMRLNNITIV